MGVVSRAMQIQAKLDRLNSGGDLCINDEYQFEINDFKRGTSEVITLYKKSGAWFAPIPEN